MGNLENILQALKIDNQKNRKEKEAKENEVNDLKKTISLLNEQ